jgi:hypothetical protein
MFFQIQFVLARAGNLLDVNSSRKYHWNNSFQDGSMLIGGDDGVLSRATILFISWRAL